MVSRSKFAGQLAQCSELRVNSSSFCAKPIPQQNRPFHIADTTSVESQYYGSSDSLALAASPASSDSSSSIDSDYQRDQSPASGKRSPSWVARPRNCFMIFRCQYSRAHCREGKRIRRPPGSKPEKSLSKRAAEAWHQLTTYEKERYQALAHQEASEHARLHPEYRFRPQRTRAKKRRTSSSSSSAIGSQRQLRVPPQVKKEDVKIIMASSDTLQAPPCDDGTAIKTARRRSASEPFPSEQPVILDAQTVRQLHRRSRSNTEGWMPLSIQELTPTYLDHTGSWTHSTAFFMQDPLESLVVENVDNEADQTSQSPMNNSSSLVAPSSLSNWNGEYPHSSVVDTSFYQAMSPLHGSPLSAIDPSSPLMQLPDFSLSMEAGPDYRQMLYQSPTDPWAQDAAGYPVSAVDMAIGQAIGAGDSSLLYHPVDSVSSELQSIHFAHQSPVGLGISLEASDDIANAINYYSQF